ncbi:hypothetical protein U1Q18_035543 [Sarracenia purpurea var. burkii]
MGAVKWLRPKGCCQVVAVKGQRLNERLATNGCAFIKWVLSNACQRLAVGTALVWTAVVLSKPRSGLEFGIGMCCKWGSSMLGICWVGT